LAGRSAAQGLAAVDSIKHELGDSAQVEFSLLDLSDLRSVKSFAKSFIKSKKPLHILMNSAGVMACPFALTAQGVEMQFGTNHLGHFLLTKLLLPVLRRSQPSRIVTTSSAAHYFPELIGGHNMTDIFADSNATYSPWAAYGRSKLANVLFTARLADELRGDRVYANALHPGGVRTNLKRHAEAATTGTLGKQAADAIWALVSPLMLSPAQVPLSPFRYHYFD
jgi:retinol dehydrogenase 12